MLVINLLMITLFANDCWSFSYSYSISHKQITKTHTNSVPGSSLRIYSRSSVNRLCQLGVSGIYVGQSTENKSCYYFCQTRNPTNLNNDRAYYHCCPQQYQMNLSIKQCVLIEHNLHSTKHSGTKRYPVVSGTKTSVSSNRGVTCNRGKYAPHPTDSHKYYQCFFGSRYVEMTCPLGLIWNRRRQYCDSVQESGFDDGRTSFVLHPYEPTKDSNQVFVSHKSPRRYPTTPNKPHLWTRCANNRWHFPGSYSSKCIPSEPKTPTKTVVHHQRKFWVHRVDTRFKNFGVRRPYGTKNVNPDMGWDAPTTLHDFNKSDYPVKSKPNYGFKGKPFFGTKSKPNFGFKEKPIFGIKSKPKFWQTRRPNYGVKRPTTVTKSSPLPSFGGTSSRPTYGTRLPSTPTKTTEIDTETVTPTTRRMPATNSITTVTVNEPTKPSTVITSTPDSIEPMLNVEQVVVSVPTQETEISTESPKTTETIPPEAISTDEENNSLTETPTIVTQYKPEMTETIDDGFTETVPPTTPTTPVTNSTNPAVILEENETCYVPTSRFKDDNDCQCFYECQFNLKLTRNCCSNGLVFNQIDYKPGDSESSLEESEEQAMCDLPENVQCKDRIQK